MSQRPWRTLALAAALLSARNAAAADPAASPPPAGKVRVADGSRQLSIQGVSGRSVTKVVALGVEADAPVMDGLKFVATPLSPVNPADDAKSAPHVTTDPETVRLRPGEPPVQVLVTVPLTGLSHGEYRTVLRLTRPDGKQPGDAHVEAEIPVDVKVHHDWPWPTGVLIAGVAVGMFSTWFKSTGKDRDVALTGRDGLVKTVNDPSLPPVLAEALNPVVTDIDRAIAASDWAAAQGAVKKGEAIVYHWRRDRADWEDLCNYLTTFQGELEHDPQDSVTVWTIKEQIRKDSGTLASAETTEPFRNQLNVWRDQLETFRKTQAVLATLTRLRAHAPAESADTWSTREDEFNKRLNDLAPDDKAGFATLQADLTAATTELTKAISDHPHEALTAGASAAVPVGAAAAPVPVSSVPGLAARGWAASLVPTVDRLSLFRSVRLRAMGWFGYLFPASVFIYTGLNQLYQNDPTFGSLADYVSLFLWGFGSDAGGSKFQDLVLQTGSAAGLEGALRRAGRTDGEKGGESQAGGARNSQDAGHNHANGDATMETKPTGADHPPTTAHPPAQRSGTPGGASS